MSGTSIKDNLSLIQEKIQKACLVAGRSPDDVKVLAVSKKQSLESIEKAIAVGLRNFGENYVQELLEKKEHFAKREVHWHFIGHLQTNKVKKVIGHIDLLHTLDSLKLALEISKKAVDIQRVQESLVQLNIAKENSKTGLFPNQLMEFVEEVKNYPGLCLRGIMIMPPVNIPDSELREYFSQTRTYLNEVKKKFPLLKKFSELSMGTSHDYIIAIEEGATIVRLGTSLLGARGV